jgi:hypothetical protein
MQRIATIVLVLTAAAAASAAAACSFAKNGATFDLSRFTLPNSHYSVCGC